MSSSVIVKFTLVMMSIGSMNSVDIDSTMTYLSKYGYLPPRSRHSGTITDFQGYSNALAHFQNMAGLPVTGKMNKNTEDAMKMPRCGVPDETNKQSYVLAAKWEKRHLTYKVFQYSGKLRTDDIYRELARAFAAWAKHTDLTFTRSSSDRVDIEVRFTPHGAGGTYFDGEGGTLAYAYFPQNGDVYFDEAEQWVANKGDGTSFFYVALHELGHSLGLSHSNIKEAVMYPIYRPNHPDLSADDIDGIQKLYGRKTGYFPPHALTTLKPYIPPKKPYPPTKKPYLPTKKPYFPTKKPYPPTKKPYPPSRKPHHPNKPPHFPGKNPTKRPYNPPKKPNKPNNPKPIPDPILCRDPKIDAAFRASDSKMYIFKGDNYWQLTDKGLAKGFPKKIDGSWVGLPPNIDAAFSHHKKNYFFKGHLYWVYDDRKPIRGYPKLIAQEFNGIPSKLDAASSWRGTPVVYFFKGTFMYSYDFTKKITSLVSKSWTLNNLDAVFEHKNKKTYFLRHNHFYRSDDITHPMSIADDIFRCSGKPNRNNPVPGKRKVPFHPPAKRAKRKRKV